MLVPGARDGGGVSALVVVEVVFEAEQSVGLNGVPKGAVRQTLSPARRFEQLELLISGLKA